MLGSVEVMNSTKGKFAFGTVLRLRRTDKRMEHSFPKSFKITIAIGYSTAFLCSFVYCLKYWIN